jgi:ribA/ribD-fused uncharacterized protein
MLQTTLKKYEHNCVPVYGGLAHRGYHQFLLFYGGPFSQWAWSPFEVDGVQYNCAEQYMMAQKARMFNDDRILRAIMASTSPSEQKHLGKMVKGFRGAKWDAQDREAWASVSRDVVARGSLAKFTSTVELYQTLMETEHTLLVEASPTDVIWGIGLADYDEGCCDPAQWRGTNWLGQVLTDLRESLIRARDAENLI